MSSSIVAIPVEVDIDESQKRLYDKLYRDLGPNIIDFLQDKDINEIILNSDASLWVDRVSCGMEQVGLFSRQHALAIINAVAGIYGLIVNAQKPYVEARLPIYKTMRGERFAATIPPVDEAPTFNIRKRSEIVFSLEDYVNSGRMTQKQADTLRQLVTDRQNILVCGGPGSGKTTVTNALIKAAVEADARQRFILLEDTPELQCMALNALKLLTMEHINMDQLLSLSMRRRPDRILVGEVRGAEAHSMLKAWNVGCPGGICTVHANGAVEAIQRILDLSMEAKLTEPPISLVLHTINAVVSVGRRGSEKGFVENIVALRGYENETFKFETLA